MNFSIDKKGTLRAYLLHNVWDNIFSMQQVKIYKYKQS